MNNRSAEALARGQISDAYWWVREAIRQDPNFLSAYNTLGVVYRRFGNPGAAEQVFNYALHRDPVNTQIMSNLAMVLNDAGRVAESKMLTDKVERKQPYAPFHFFSLGTEAMQAGDFSTATCSCAKLRAIHTTTSFIFGSRWRSPDSVTWRNQSNISPRR